MKTIGFVDYYLSEWHANNYPAFIKEVCDRKGLDFCVGYAWAEEYVSPVDGRNTDEWCQEYGALKCDTIAELCEKSDYIVILAPSNPEKHLEYAKEVFKYGKNTFIDKTFAPDYKTAKEIFDISKQYNTKFFTSSAFRFSEEFKDYENCENIVVTGSGTDLGEYIIHHIEICMTVIKENVKDVILEKQGEHYAINVHFENNKNAILIYAPSLPFTICGNSHYSELNSDIFKGQTEEMLNFFESGKTNVSEKDTLEGMKIMDAVMKN